MTTEDPKPQQMHRPFPQVVEALLYILPEKPKKKNLSDLLTRIAVEEPDKNRQWRFLATCMQDYMTGEPNFLKQQVIQVLRDPTEYRYILKKKEKEEMTKAGEV